MIVFSREKKHIFVLKNIISYIKYLFNDIKRSFFNVFNNYKYLQGTFFVLVLLFLIIYYPIIRANFDYNDDVLRNVGEGQFLWSECWGAHIGQLLGFVLSCGIDLYDYSPLGQIIASIFLSLSGVILISVFSSKKNFDIFNIIFVLVMGTTPSFIECLSYKFDAPIFAMSIFFSIVPLAFYKEKEYIYIIFSIISLLCSFMSYHASSGLYIVSIVFLVLYLYLKEVEIKLILRLIFKSMFAYFVAGLIFYFILSSMKFPTKALENVNNQFSLINIFINLNFKYINFLSRINMFYKTLLILILFLFIVSLCCNSKKNKVITLCIILNALFLVYIFQLGISNIFIQNDGAARYIYGYGITISIMGLMCYEFILKNKKLLIICLLFVLVCINSVVKYGNCLYNLKLESLNRVYVIINDLNKIKFNKGRYEVGIVDTDLFFKFNIGIINDPCFYVIMPPFSNLEPRMINYYFPKRKIVTKFLNFDANYETTIYKKINNMKLINEGWQNKIEMDDENNIQLTVKK